VTLPIINRIWRVRGEVPVNSSLSPEEVFARLDPLLRTHGTALAVEGETLSFAKLNPAAQDKLATFNRGNFRIEPAGAGAVLRFDLFSNALLLCFLAPLLFLGFAQSAIAINTWEAAAEASEKSAKKDEEKPKPVRKLNPVDAFLGAPAPEDPNKKKDKDDKDKGRHSPDEAYVLAGLFADRGDDRLAAMAGIDAPQPGGAIEHLAAIGGGIIHALRRGEQPRVGLEIAIVGERHPERIEVVRWRLQHRSSLARQQGWAYSKHALPRLATGGRHSLRHLGQTPEPMAARPLFGNSRRR